MALVVKDRVQEVSTTTGTGTFTLAGAVTGFQSFSAIGNGNTTYYAIVGGTEWEVGIGTYTLIGTTLSRDTILASSNGGTAVNFSAGTKNVFVTYPAGKGLYTDASGNAIALGTPASATLTNATGLPLTTGVTGTLPIANGGTGTTSTTFTNLTTNVTGTLPVSNGGTGLATLTANNVILGNGTSTPSFVAPGTNGNVLQSNGTTWVSAASAGGGVTSLNGQTGAITDTAVDAIGSYGVLWNIANTDTAVGATKAGSSLKYGLVYTTGNFTAKFEEAVGVNSFYWVLQTENNATFPISTGTALSGTWRRMPSSGKVFGTFTTNKGTEFRVWCQSLWVRVS